ncbi:MAG: hypothetical protein ABR538_01980 [Candidatus Binatia bacterium]
MMKKLRVATLALAVFGIAVTTAAAKPKAAKPAGSSEIPEVTVTGCVAKGTGSFCSILKGPDGTTYSFAGQPVVEGKCYTVTGKQTMGSCRQGTQLGVTSLVASPTDCCAKPAVAAPADDSQP